MSIFEMEEATATDGSSAWAGTLGEGGSTSPFGPSSLYAEEALSSHAEVRAGDSLTSPFAEALATLDEAELERETFETLLAEFEDEEFEGALDALAAEAAARHLRGAATWGEGDEAPVLAATEAEQWMEAVAAEADRLFEDLQAHFGDRAVDTVTAMELDALDRFAAPQYESGSPLDAQELFLGSLFKKVKKVVGGVGKLVKKGVAVLSKFSPIHRLFGVLRKLVRPLLERVLSRALGKLPPAVRGIAQKLAGRFGLRVGAVPASSGGASEFEGDEESLAGQFDTTLAEALLAPSDMILEATLAEFEAEASTDPVGVGPVHELDAARQRLARQLADAEPDVAPTEQLEQFLPVVMAARPLIKVGIGIIGRERVVKFVAGLLAKLMKGMVGPQAAELLSRHVANAGLGLLGLEAERSGDGRLGAEALVATAEDTIREVLSLPAESLASELLLEAAVQEAFTDAAIRHLPAEVLRPDLLAAEGEGEHGIWVMMPRATRPCYRYKKYSRIVPLTITRSLARRIVFPSGETLEDQLLDAGAQSFPVQGEVHLYETLPGTELGHLAAFELEGEVDSFAEGALEFEELAASQLPPIPSPTRRAQASPGRSPRPHTRPASGRRYYRIRVPGLRLRRRRLFTVRLDLAAARPALQVHLQIGERRAHALVAHLQHNRHAQVVVEVRRLLGAPMQQALAARLERILTKHDVSLPPGDTSNLVQHLIEAMSRTVAKQLPAAAATLATAAKDPATGVTLSFSFPFPRRGAIGKEPPGEPTLTIRPGSHHD